jgi:putative DNA primase/helicase
MNHDFNELNQKATPHIESICRELFPAGKKAGREFKIGSLSGEPGDSMSINTQTGMWADFATGEKGGILRLIQLSRNTDIKSAADWLSGKIGSAPTPAPSKSDTWVAMPFAPEPANEFVLMNKGRNPTAVWEYLGKDKEIRGYIARFDNPTGKEVLPLTWCKSTSGATGWKWKAMAEPRPLFNLPEIIRNSDPIIIAEGEKAASALIAAGFNATTWSGGSSAHGKSYWEPLRGRECVIWPDNDSAGFLAAEAIEKRLESICARISMVVPPVDAEAGWDAADATPEQMRQLIDHAEWRASTAPEPGEDADTDSYQTDRIADMPFRLLGADGELFYYMPDKSQQIVSLAASAHSKNNLMRLAPLQSWEVVFPGNSQGTNWDAAINALIQRSQSMPMFDSRRIRGRGCWIDGGDIVYHAGDRLVINGQAVAIPKYNSSRRAIYHGALRIDTETEEIASNSESAKLIDLCEMLSWERPLYGKLLAGWLALAPIGGALRWRPHMWVTGPSGSGKSWIVSNIIQPLVGDAALHVQGATSEAGIRGMLGSDSLPVVFDEAESEDKASQMRFESILTLARQSSTETGAGIVKGTAQGGSVTYLIRSAFCFASIGVAAVKKSDVSRISILQLKKNLGRDAAEHFDRVVSLWKTTVSNDSYCSKFRARCIKNAKIIRDNCEIFSRVAVDFTGDKRSADQIGALLAGAYSLTTSKIVSDEIALDFMKRQDWAGFKSEDVDNDENQCLAHLAASAIKFDVAGVNYNRTISEVIADIQSDPLSGDDAGTTLRRKDRMNALQRHGVRFCPETRGIYVANNHPALEQIFSNTAWGTSKWKHQLERVTGAKRMGVMVFGGQCRQRCVWIPI